MAKDSEYFHLGNMEKKLKESIPEDIRESVVEAVIRRNEENPDANNTPWTRLSEKKQKTAVAYVNGLPKVRAMIKGGYNKDYARCSYQRVFADPDLQWVIAEMRQEMAEKADVSPDWVISQLTSIANANLSDLLQLANDQGLAKIDLSLLDENLKIALEEITIDEYMRGRGDNATPAVKVRVKLAPKLKALEMLCRKLGLFDDKVTIKAEQNIIDQINQGRQRASGKPDLKVVGE